MNHITMKRVNRSRMRGFTLLELMIVIVIVAILAGVGYPAYVGYADRARRADGRSFLLDAAARQERYFFDNNRYTTTTGDLGYTSSPPSSPEGNYTLTVAVGATGSIATSYALTAAPTYTERATTCGNLTLDSRGAKGQAGGTSEICWGR